VNDLLAPLRSALDFALEETTPKRAARFVVGGLVALYVLKSVVFHMSVNEVINGASLG